MSFNRPTNKDSDNIKVERLAYSVQETADALGVSYITVYRLLQRGVLKAIPSLRHRIIPAKEIDRFLETAE